MTTATIAGFTGSTSTPGDADYEQARAVWNAMHDKHPAIIARCTSPADVAAAIAHARRRGLPIAVRGGGHSLPGLSVVDDGMVVDVRPMRAITVDPRSRRASVGAGALLGEVDAATQEHGLVVPAGVISHTGVAGLTLGGGVGRLMRRFGLTVDSLLGVELVTADGAVLTADADHHPDLFWAVRGGGGNLGVVTRFEFALHPLTDLVVLSAFHPLTDAHRVLALAQSTMAPTADGRQAPDELLWTSFVRRAPQRPWMREELVGAPGVMTVVEWSGDLAEGRERLADLQRALAAPASALDVVPFLVMQRAGDEEFGHGMLSYTKAGFGQELSPALVDVLVERAGSLRSPLAQVELLSTGGAIARVPVDATAYPHRGARWLVNVPDSWTDPRDTAHEVAWVRETFAALAPFCSAGAYANFMEGDEPAAAQLAYGPALRRLQEVKAVYDPGNTFRLNQNVAPVAAR